MVVSVFALLLLIRLDVGLVGTGQEVVDKEYVGLELREVVENRLGDANIEVEDFLDMYTVVDNREMGERIKKNDLVNSNYKMNLLVSVDGERCSYYYKEGISLKYCKNGLEEITIKPENKDLKGVYGFKDEELKMYTKLQDKFQHKDLLIGADYILRGTDKLAVTLKISVVK